MGRPKKTPQPTRHKGQARVRWTDDAGTRHERSLGPWGSEQARDAYRAFLEEHLARMQGSRPAGGLTVQGLVAKYATHARSYYSGRDGRETSELGNMRVVLRRWRKMFEGRQVASMTTADLKAFRLSLIDLGLSRPTVNSHVGRLLRVIRWGVSEQLVPSSTWESVRSVERLKRFRSPAREGREVPPVPWEQVEATLPELSPQVRAIVLVLWHTGMRAGEPLGMTTGGLGRISEDVWQYTPTHHKTEHTGRRRPVFLGPRAMAVIGPWLRADPDAPLWQPRNAPKATKRAGDTYTTDALRRAVQRAAERAGVPRWHPSQLRHSFATRLAPEHGIHLVGILQGHADPDTTAIYIQADMQRAAELAQKVC